MYTVDKLYTHIFYSIPNIDLIIKEQNIIRNTHIFLLIIDRILHTTIMEYKEQNRYLLYWVFVLCPLQEERVCPGKHGVYCSKLKHHREDQRKIKENAANGINQWWWGELTESGGILHCIPGVGSSNKFLACFIFLMICWNFISWNLCI